MNEMEHEAQRAALASYVLGALEPEEADELERHIERCPDCRAELVWLMPAARMLPEAVDQVDAPAGLRERVMAAVEMDAAPAAGAAVGRRSWLERLGERLPGGLGPRPVTAVFAALLVAVAVATGFAIGGGDGNGGAVTTVVSEEGVTATLVRGEDGGTLELDDVADLPPERVLQAWVRRGETIESADVYFLPDAEGMAVAALDHLEGVDAVMVSVEPSGGSEMPTTDPIVEVGVPR